MGNEFLWSLLENCHSIESIAMLGIEILHVDNNSRGIHVFTILYTHNLYMKQMESSSFHFFYFRSLPSCVELASVSVKMIAFQCIGTKSFAECAANSKRSKPKHSTRTTESNIHGVQHFFFRCCSHRWDVLTTQYNASIPIDCSKFFAPLLLIYLGKQKSIAIFFGKRFAKKYDWTHERELDRQRARELCLPLDFFSIMIEMHLMLLYNIEKGWRRKCRAMKCGRWIAAEKSIVGILVE